MKKLKLTSIILSILISSSILYGCKAKPEVSNAPVNVDDNTPITLTYWVSLSGNSAATLASYSEMEMFKELEKKTNIKLDFKHPPTGQEKEQFNLMLASRDYPDIIEYGWGGYSGGPEKAISDGVIIKLNDLLSKYSPNFSKVLKENAVIDKQAKTDSGTYYMFPAIGGKSNKTTGGPIVRKDWLDDLGLKLPETMDDWTNMLKQFKEKKGATAAFVCDNKTLSSNSFFSGAYNLGVGFYLDNGKVKYGPGENDYKKYLELLRGWYKDGLLDPDFAANNSKAVESKVTTNKAGGFYGNLGGAIGTFMNAMKGKDDKFNLAGAVYPSEKSGGSNNFIQYAWEVRTSGMAAITSKNKYPERTAKMFDYLYSEEGTLLKNFGIENKTYKMENGYPKYTELITNNPDKLSMAQAGGKYFRGTEPSPGWIDDRYAEQYTISLPQQRQAKDLWSKYSDNALKVMLPQVTPTAEESEEFSNIMSSVSSYKDEMFTKFVMGAESLDNFNKYISTIKSMKIDKAIEINQKALDRYNKR